MSVLLIGLADDLVDVLAARLIRQMDEVRALVTDQMGGAGTGTHAVHIASGPYLDDPDLVERAAQNVRTIVLGDHWEPRTVEALQAIADGARAAGVGRLVLVGTRIVDWASHVIEGFEYVLLRAPRKGVLRRSGLSLDEVAEAIDAADDLAGQVKLDLDLNDDEAWRDLRLAPPKRS